MFFIIYFTFISYIKADYIPGPNGTCVNFYENHIQISWSEAKDFCKNDGNNADLVIITDAGVNAWFQTMSTAKFSNLSNSYWWANAFEMFDANKGIYSRWDDVNHTEMNYKNMGPSNNFITNTNSCLAISAYNGNWETSFCNKTAHFICSFTPKIPVNCSIKTSPSATTAPTITTIASTATSSSIINSFSTSADCPELILTVYQPIICYNPGGISNPVVANCSFLLGYNVTEPVGLSGAILYCKSNSMDAGDTVVITDGIMTTIINSTLCEANNNGNNEILLFNGSYSNFLNVTVTEVSNKAPLFALQFQQAQLLTSQQTTTPVVIPQSTTITTTTSTTTATTTTITAPSTNTTSTTVPITTATTNIPSSTTDPIHYSNLNWLIFLGVGILLFIFTVFLLIYCLLRYNKKKRRELIDKLAYEMRVQPTIKGEPKEYIKQDNFWIEEKRLEVNYEESLGTGFSSNVYVGNLFGASVLVSFKKIKTTKFQNCKVAIKIANDYGNNESAILESEIKLMKKIGYHEYIVPMLGWSIKQNKPCLVLELCEGNLLNYVKEHHEVLFKSLISILWQIVQGMEYLVSKRLVHRDLAARNILLIDNHTAKITDFGLCCTCDDATLSYQALSQKKLPMRWLSLEAILQRTFSEKSDVWAFGILMYEIFSGGKVPYATMEAGEILEFLKSGKRMECPEKASDEVYEIMCSCWEENVKTRTSFSELSTKLRSILLRETQDYGYVCSEE